MKETPSAVTESTKGGTTPSSAMASQRYPRSATAAMAAAGESLDLSSPSQSMEDDRKPAAVPREGNLKMKEPSPPAVHQGHHDYEPIPLDKIAAIPVLSSSAAAAMDRPSSRGHAPAPTYGEGAAYPHSWPQTFSPPPENVFAAPPHAQRVATAASNTSVSSRVAPPAPRSAPGASARSRRPHQRTLVASSSGSTSAASSTGGAGGEGSWERRFVELTDFRRVHGHCEVPQNYAENTSLGTWVNKQRMEHKNRIEGKNSSLNDSRLERLQSVGFRWAKRKGQASWDEKYNELVAYKARYGNCHVPTKYKENTALGRWVSTQRAEYKKYQEGQAKTSMNADKIRRLESIGFAWFMAL